MAIADKLSHRGAASVLLRRPRRRGGVVLLIVVACVLLAGIAMVGVTRQSLRLATDSVEAESELQQRWGTISLQRTLLHSAPKIFADLDKRSLQAGNTGPFPSTVRSQVLLGGIQFDALLADEQAKLNLNSAYHGRSGTTAQLLARKMKGPVGLRVRLLPEVPSAAKLPPRPSSSDRGGIAEDDVADEKETPPPPAAFRHWGQVFDLSNSLGGVATSRLLPAATTRLTCWGYGEVNIKRAPDSVVEENCRTVLGPGVARKLVRRYRENPTLNIRQIAMELEFTEQEMMELGRLVTTQSSTYSLWSTSTSSNRMQRWFAVAAPSNEMGITTERFRF